ncbi:MAG: hypothetical protein QM784_37090 [Polyangiaceae bacterium]
MRAISNLGWVFGVSVLLLACQQKVDTTASNSSSAAVTSQPVVGKAPEGASTGFANDPTVSATHLATRPHQCVVFCRRSVELKCKLPVEQCMSNCSEMLALPNCQNELGEVFHCFEKEPVDHWECDGDGMPAIRGGFCESVQRAFAACVATSGGADDP